MWAEDQHGLCRAPQPHYASACTSGRAACEHAVSGTRRLTAAVGAIPNVIQFLPSSCLFTPALTVTEPINSRGSAARWQLRTPAMAAGVTDHVWTLRELLLFRGPPWPQPAMVGANSGGGKQPEEGASAGDMRPHGLLQGRHQGPEGRWEARSILSIRPFYPLKGRPGEPVVFIRSMQVHGQWFSPSYKPHPTGT